MEHPTTARLGSTGVIGFLYLPADMGDRVSVRNVGYRVSVRNGVTPGVYDTTDWPYYPLDGLQDYYLSAYAVLNPVTLVPLSIWAYVWGGYRGRVIQANLTGELVVSSAPVEITTWGPQWHEFPLEGAPALDPDETYWLNVAGPAYDYPRPTVFYGPYQHPEYGFYDPNEAYDYCEYVWFNGQLYHATDHADPGDAPPGPPWELVSRRVVLPLLKTTSLTEGTLLVGGMP